MKSDFLNARCCMNRPDGSMPWRASTARTRSLLLATLMCCFFFFFSGPNDCIFYLRYILQNSPNLKCTLHLPKNVIICCHPQFPSLGDGIIKESAFLLIAPILLRTFKYHIHAFSELYWIWWYSPRPFQQISANSQNIAKLLFRTPRRQFHWYERNFPHSKMHH